MTGRPACWQYRHGRTSAPADLDEMKAPRPHIYNRAETLSDPASLSSPPPAATRLIISTPPGHLEEADAGSILEVAAGPVHHLASSPILH